MITKETAGQIWNCFQEIENGEKLLSDMQEQLKQYEDPNPRDAFGKRRNLQLGIPCGNGSSRLMDVHPTLAMAIIKAHIAEKRSILEVLNETAKKEVDATK